MKKLIIFVVILVALAGATYFFIFNPNANEEPAPEVSNAQTEQAPASAPTPMASTNPGEYKEYSERVANATEGTKLLFFHAPWCPQCRSLEASIQKGTIPNGITIFKVDYDSNQALRKKYGVTIQTTIVRVNDAGELVEKYVAYDEPTLAAVLKNAL